MWAITFADLRYRYRQFLIAVVGAGLVLAMALLMMGLAAGFTAEIDRTVSGVGAQSWVLGSSSLALFGSLALQAVVITLLAAVFGMAICNFMVPLFKQPIAIPGSAFATLPAIAVLVGLIASLAGLRRATGADPAMAFSG